MVPLWIEHLDISTGVEEKLWAKHQRIRFVEVEEVCAEDYRVERLGDGLYLVLGRTAAGRHLAVILAPVDVGRWKVVTRKETLEGLFTLVLRRFPDGWKIVHDHTSQAEPPKKE